MKIFIVIKAYVATINKLIRRHALFRAWPVFMKALFEYNDILLAPYEAFTDMSRDGRKSVEPHWHYYTEIIYLLSGSALVTTDNHKYQVSAGELVLFFPRAVHSIELSGSEELVYYVLKFDINRLNVTNSYTPKLSSVFSAAKDTVSGYFPLYRISHLELSQLIGDCVREMKNREYGYDLILHSRISSLLVLLLRVWRSCGFNIDKISSEKSDDESIYTITEYIDEHSGELINIQNLAKMCNMSYSYFAREFKRLYGRSCKEYIEFIKTCKVENMLMFTDFDLNYISQETGFSDSSHLIKIFKRQKGITPKQFKKQKNIG